MSSLESYMELISKQAMAWTPRFLSGAACFMAFYLASWWAQRLLQKLGKKAHREQRAVFDLAAASARYGILLFGAITALGTMGVQVGALVAGLGLTGFALGFALKDAVSNLLAGVLLLIYRPFHTHDKIKVKSFEGEVIEIDLRYTTLKCGGNRVLVPNSVLISNPIIVFQEAS